jgi:hypothetical protein
MHAIIDNNAHCFAKASIRYATLKPNNYLKKDNVSKRCINHIFMLPMRKMSIKQDIYSSSIYKLVTIRVELLAWQNRIDHLGWKGNFMIEKGY